MKEKKSFEILVLADNNNGYITVSDAKRNGIAQTYLVSAEEEGQFKKVARGLYVKKGYPLDSYYILQFTYKKAVFSKGSALLLHELVDEAPISVNLPRGYMNKGIEKATCYHTNEKEYFLGLGLAVTPIGHLVETYDLERSFIDAYRYKEECGFDMKEIFARFKSRDIDKEKLLEYAKELKCLEAMKAYLSLI